MEYVMGLVFSPDLKTLLLIHNKWDKKFYASKLNGLGGKMSWTERPVGSFLRELEEETTGKITKKDLLFTPLHLVTIKFLYQGDTTVHFFCAMVSPKINSAAPGLLCTEYENLEGNVGWYSVSSILSAPEVLLAGDGNLKWLIELSLGRLYERLKEA